MEAKEQRKEKLLLETWTSLTFTERSYYEAWSTWKTFKRTLPPWRYFGTKGIKHDHIKMIEQFESLLTKRQDAKRRAEDKQDQLSKQQSNRPVFSERSNKTISVL